LLLLGGEELLTLASLREFFMERIEDSKIYQEVAKRGGMDAAIQAALEIGPASRALEGHPAELRAAAVTSIQEALAPFAKGNSVLLPGAIWIVTARA